MSDSVDILLKYFPDLTVEEKLQFSKLKPLYEEWNAKINLIKTVRDNATLEEEKIRKELEHLKILARLPKDTGIRVVHRSPEMWSEAPLADLNILELPDKEELDLYRLQEMPNKLRTACLFTLDSNIENALI